MLASNAQYYYNDGIYYNIYNDGTCQVFTTVNPKKAPIPSTIYHPDDGKTYIVTRIKDEGFINRKSLSSVTLPSTLKIIGNSAFYGCSILSGIDIPDGVTTIGGGAFGGTKLFSVKIPSSVQSIGQNPFNYTTYLSSIIVEDGNTVYDSRSNCNAIIETETNTLISGCKNTVIPDGVISIADDAFSSCIGLTSIDIPNSVTSIGTNSFSGSGLTSIIIPSSVNSIADWAFFNCNLTSVVIGSDIPVEIGYFTFNCQANATLYVPYGCKEAYESANFWKEFKEIVEMSASSAQVSAKCVAQEGGKYAYGKLFLPKGSGMKYCVDAEVEGGVTGVNLFSATIDGTDIRMKQVDIIDGCYWIDATERDQVFVVRTLKTRESLEVKAELATEEIIAAQETLTEDDWFDASLAKKNALRYTPSKFENQKLRDLPEFEKKGIYVMANPKNRGLAFALLDQYNTSNVLVKNSIYILTKKDVYARELNVIWDDDRETTGIDTIRTVEENKENGSVIYNLQGVRVKNAQKGFFIINGMKVVKE